MIVIKYFWMYVLLGLICNTTWAIGAAIYIGHKCNWETNIIEGACDAFIGFKGAYSLIQKIIKKDKPNYCLILIESYLTWPCNIAYGATRMPYVINYIDENYKNES